MNGNHQNVGVPGLPLFSVSNLVPKDIDYTGEESDRLEGGKKPKIIVVDDEALIAETVVEILNQEGFAAISASSGASAIELAKVVHPAIILSDVIMPGLNGIEMGIKIREIVPTCKVILSLFRPGCHGRFARTGPEAGPSFRNPRQADQAGTSDPGCPVQPPLALNLRGRYTLPRRDIPETPHTKICLPKL